MEAGDFLLLLESIDFAYVGEVIHRVTQHCWELSSHIWGEARFPLIILLKGELILYSWTDFREHFGFAANYHMRGNTMRLNPNRIARSQSRTEEAFIAQLLATAGTAPLELRQV
jgi:hypothetical protein